MKQYILVVDDSLTVRMDLRGAFNSAGFLVETCTTLAEARKALQSQTFLLIIVDSILPDGSGLDLLRDMRAFEKKVRAPVMILSSQADVRHRVFGLIQGAYEYVDKPYNKSYLVKLAHSLKKPQGFALSAVSDLSLDHTKIALIGSGSQRLLNLYGVLHRDGHGVVFAGSGEEAITLFAVDRFDGIVVDLTVASSGGVDICRRIRGRRKCHGAAIIALCADMDERTHVERMLCGIDEVCLTSSDPEFLKERIRGVIHKKRSEDSARASEGSRP